MNSNKINLLSTSQKANSNDKELVDIVNCKGKITGKTTRAQAYKKGLLHPAVNIIVVNNKGQIFIQKRTHTKVFPLHWDISASEHVKSGEGYKAAAQRGLEEELSIMAPVQLLRNQHIQRNEYTKDNISLIEHELVELYGATYNGKIKINPEEVTEGQFIFLEKLNELIETNQIKFTPWGLEEINYLLNNPNIISGIIH